MMTKSTNNDNNNIFSSNKFNIKRLEGKNIVEFNEKIMKKTLDVSLLNENNSNNKKGKDEYEESNEILEVVELNNIIDGERDVENVVIDYKKDENIQKNNEKLLTFANNELGMQNMNSGKDSKNNEIESITIEIKSKYKDNQNQEIEKSQIGSLCFTPPSISSSLITLFFF